MAYEYLTGPPPGAAPGSGPDPLWPAGSRIHGQRFTPKGSFDTVYLAPSAQTALAEVGAVFRSVGPRRGAPDPQVLVQIDGRVADILDTTDPAIMSALGTTPAELTGPWAYVAGGVTAPTQRLGLAAHRSGRVHGILYTSAKDPPACCLCVFPDRLVRRNELLKVTDGSGKLASRLP